MFVVVGCPEPEENVDDGEQGHETSGDAGVALTDGGPLMADGGPHLANCGTQEEIGAMVLAHEATFDSLTQNVDSSPTPTILPEDTNGTLQLGLHSGVVPIMQGPDGVFAAASQLGSGRVVAFSGQDFLGSQNRSTLLGEPNIDQMVKNSARWVGVDEETSGLRVRVANERLATLFSNMGYEEISVAPVFEIDGLWQLQDWTADALMEVDVAVVQVNEWGTLHVGPDQIEALRSYVEGGGGLIIAGSALHYSWWLSDSAGGFIADRILEGTGISYVTQSVRDLSNATVSFSAHSIPEARWCDYVRNVSISDDVLFGLEGSFVEAKEVGRNEELNLGLARLIAETPHLPVSSQNAKARLSANVAISLPPHQWPEPHPWTSTFPGVPTSEPSPEEIEVTIDATYSGAQPLGAYAPPGQIVQVHMSTVDAARGVTIRVGELYDDLRHLSHISTWNRAPMLKRDFEVEETSTTVVSPYGGSLSILLPPDETGDIAVSIEGAIPMAVHTKGVSNAGDWQTALAGGAPQAILEEKGRVRMVVAADAAALVTNPDDIVEFWSGFHASHADLAQEPETRMYESHWIFDVQVGWGYANATGDRITYPKLSEVWALRTQTGDEDWWLFGHELGHQFQTSNWSGGDITEVAVNLFTMYTLNDYIFNGGQFETQGFNPNTIDHAELQSYVWATADLFGKLQLYRQLIFEFGWAPFKETFASYYSSDYPVSSYGEFMDGFAIRFSVMVERDLSGFFEHWEYPISVSAVETIETFGYDPWLPPGW